MFYPSGEISQKLDSHFVAQEADQLHLTPAVSGQLQEMTQHVVGEFEDNVNKLSTNFVNFLQQDPTPSHQKVMQKLNSTQMKIDHAHDQMIDQIKTHLHQTAGPKYATAIEQFVEDVKGRVAEYTHLEDKVRQDPELNKKMPPRSLFEMMKPAPEATIGPQSVSGAQAPSQAAAVGTSETPLTADDRATIKARLEQELSGVLEEYNNDPNNPYYKAYQQLINEIEGSVNQSGTWERLGSLLTDLLKGSGANGRDFYMKYPELIPSDPHQDSDICFQLLWSEIFPGSTGQFYPGAPTPYTSMDQRYIDLYNQQPPPAKGSLLWTLMNQIKQYGSSDSHLADLQKWTQSQITGRTNVYVNATLDDMQTFMDAYDTPVTDPLYSSYQAIAAFQGSSSSTAQFQLAKEIQALYNSCHTLNELISKINSLLQKNSPQDIYMANGGVDFSIDLKTLGSQVGFTAPAYTAMDGKYFAANQWAQKQTGPDLAVANELLTTIRQLGSSATQADLTSWAQSIINTRDPPYATASPATWQTLTDLTGAKDPILTCYNNISQWEGNYPSGSPMNQLAEDLQKFCYSCKTTEQFVASINQFLQQKSPQDVYMSYGAGGDGQIITDGDLQKLSSGLPGLSIPPFTKMDTAYKLVEFDIADTEVYKPRDMVALKALEAKIESLGSSDQNTPALIAWGRDMGSSPEYKEASLAGQIAFDRAIDAVIGV